MSAFHFSIGITFRLTFTMHLHVFLQSAVHTAKLTLHTTQITIRIADNVIFTLLFLRAGKQLPTLSDLLFTTKHTGCIVQMVTNQRKQFNSRHHAPQDLACLQTLSGFWFFFAEVSSIGVRSEYRFAEIEAHTRNPRAPNTN